MSMKCDLAYVIQVDLPSGIIKVGRSGAPQRRIAGIAQSVPFRVKTICILTHGQQTERELKQSLADSRVRGEWFEPSEKVTNELQRLAECGRMVTRVDVNLLYAEEYVLPRIRAYVASKTANRFNNNAAGDLVFRMIHGEPLTFVGREPELMKAVPNVFTGPELLGWQPTTEYVAINLEPTVHALATPHPPRR